MSEDIKDIEVQENESTKTESAQIPEVLDFGVLSSFDMLGLVGIKVGMTRVFSEDGASKAVTVIKVNENRVLNLKTKEKNGYQAISVVSGEVHGGRLNKATAGVFKKAKVQPGYKITEFRLDDVDAAVLDEVKTGQIYNAGLFKDVSFVDVAATTKGKGFQGGVKRHGFKTQDATHGNSLSHRALGSTGQCQTPGRVFKGKKMPGHMGSVKQTTQNLELIKVNPTAGYMLVAGAVPGSRNSAVLVTKAKKKNNN